ncbi:MAG TPA: sigma-70 family RNA polymerase sigma factor [bacterium]|nr:sigma-70 family RNA polymerase sigma factor [bacterium]HPP11368.1 sigma-70 family RNA polymerase sigma factor [bacterium]
MELLAGTKSWKSPDAMSLTETELVQRAKSGDNKAFEQLMLMNQGKIYNLGLKLLRNREDAADLLQETFIKAYQNLGEFEGKSSFSTWIYRIATNFALMKLRQRKTRNVSLETMADQARSTYNREILDWSDNPQAHLKNQELKMLLEAAITSLPPKYKTVFILHDIEGLPLARVAEILSLSIPAVKTRIHRSRLYLREKLSRYFREREN